MLPITYFSHTTFASVKPGDLVYRLYNGISKPQLLIQAPNGDLRVLDLKAFTTAAVDAREPVFSLGAPEWRVNHNAISAGTGISAGDIVVTPTDTLIQIPNVMTSGMFASISGVYQPVNISGDDVIFTNWEVGTVVDGAFVAVATKP